MVTRTLLSSEQRTRLFSIPTDLPEMARHYTLSLDDLGSINTKRRAANRLGCAVLLCLLRYPGFGLGPAVQPPEAMIAFIAHQLGIPATAFADYAEGDQTRRGHVIELQKYLELRSFGLGDWRSSLRIGRNVAWATDPGEPIIMAILTHLRTSGVVLPPPMVLERIGLAARARVRKKTFEVMAAGMSDAERGALTELLTVDPELRRSRFAWLRDYSESPAPSNIVSLLDRLDYVRALGIDPARAGRIHAARLARLTDEGAIMTVQHIADLEAARRTAILVAQAASLETRLTDAALAMFEKYVGTLFSRARNRDERRFQATRRDVARALLHHVHQTDLRIAEHYTDTAGATDHVFGLCHLLGYRFAPRIKDLRERKLYTIEKPGTWPLLAPLIGDAVETAVILGQWPELMRLKTSINAGTVLPSVILRKLAAARSGNTSSRALRALGRIERTLFTLQWLSDPALRQRSHAGLNKGEASNALRRAVFFHRQGEIRDRTFENQSFRASGLSLITAAIVHWNTVYLDQAVHHLRAQGIAVPDDLLAHVAPLGWEHIALTGDYVWNAANPNASFRPLRDVRAPFIPRAA